MTTPTTIQCPANIEFLLHCHTRYDSFDREDSPHHKELVKEWLEVGVIERHEPFGSTPCSAIGYRTTPLGKAWVQALCNVPIPKQVFVDEQGRPLL